MAGFAKPMPRLSTARAKRLAAASSAAKALTACLLKLTTALAPKAIPKAPANFLTLLLEHSLHFLNLLFNFKAREKTVEMLAHYTY